MNSLPSVLDKIIDVSHHNGVIDWSAVARSGIVLAMIKATEGTGFTDPRFRDNLNGARDAGLMVIPYHFLRASVPAENQAAFFLSVVRPASGAALMLDWEPAVDGMPSVTTMVAVGQAVEAAVGRAPLVYYGYSVISAPNPVLSTWPLMLPAYPKGNTMGDYASLVINPPRLPPGRPDDRPYDFHQYTPAGRVSGISGNVDRSVWVGTLDELRAWYVGGASAAKPVAQTPPDAASTKTILRPMPLDATVEDVQRRLIELRYPLPGRNGGVDGDAGGKTCGAILDALKGLS